MLFYVFIVNNHRLSNQGGSKNKSEVTDYKLFYTETNQLLNYEFGLFFDIQQQDGKILQIAAHNLHSKECPSGYPGYPCPTTNCHANN